jgi:UrcA family protein
MAKNYLVVAASALAILGFGGGVQAAETPAAAPGASSAKVSLSGVDLKTEEGARVALQRIRMAAVRVCNGESDSDSYDLGRPYVYCLHATVAKAVDELGSPMVTALNAPRGRRPVLLAAASHH